MMIKKTYDHYDEDNKKGLSTRGRIYLPEEQLIWHTLYPHPHLQLKQ